jgi:hypothetical protein
VRGQFDRSCWIYSLLNFFDFIGLGVGAACVFLGGFGLELLLVFDLAFVEGAADDLAEEGVLHCIGAEQRDIEGGGSIGDIDQSVRIRVYCFLHLDLLGSDVHLSDESRIAVAFEEFLFAVVV